MDELLISQCVASNVCHEIANSMSIIKLLYDEVYEKTKKAIPEDIEELEGLKTGIQTAILSVDFFRCLYSPVNSKNNILDIISDMYAIKKIKLSGLNLKSSDFTALPALEKAAAVLLFVMLKLCSHDMEIAVNTRGNSVHMNIQKYSEQFEQGIRRFLDTKEEYNAFNVLAHYIRMLLSETRHLITIDNKILGTLKIIIDR